MNIIYLGDAHLHLISIASHFELLDCNPVVFQKSLGLVFQEIKVPGNQNARINKLFSVRSVFMLISSNPRKCFVWTVERNEL